MKKSTKRSATKRGTKKATSKRTAGKTVRAKAPGMPRSPKQWAVAIAARNKRNPMFWGAVQHEYGRLDAGMKYATATPQPDMTAH